MPRYQSVHLRTMKSAHQRPLPIQFDSTDHRAARGHTTWNEVRQTSLDYSRGASPFASRCNSSHTIGRCAGVVSRGTDISRGRKVELATQITNKSRHTVSSVLEIEKAYHAVLQMQSRPTKSLPRQWSWKSRSWRRTWFVGRARPLYHQALIPLCSSRHARGEQNFLRNRCQLADTLQSGTREKLNTLRKPNNLSVKYRGPPFGYEPIGI